MAPLIRALMVPLLALADMWARRPVKRGTVDDLPPLDEPEDTEPLWKKPPKP